MAENKNPETDLVDDLLSGARAAAPVPGADLLARIGADADRQLRPAAPAQAARPRRRLGGLFAGIGGWPALAGLATATIAGVWIGYAPPAPLQSVSDGLLGEQSDYVLGSFGAWFDDPLSEG